MFSSVTSWRLRCQLSSSVSMDTRRRTPPEHGARRSLIVRLSRGHVSLAPPPPPPPPAPRRRPAAPSPAPRSTPAPAGPAHGQPPAPARAVSTESLAPTSAPHEALT